MPDSPHFLAEEDARREGKAKEPKTETIADLQRQLRQAQKELDGLREFLTETQNAMQVVEWQRNTAEAERDAAIEQAREDREWLRLMLREAEGMPEEGMAKALMRAEAAEREATKQRALAEELKAEAVEELYVKDHWEEHCKFCDMMWPVGEAPRHEEACPAEALRAEHRSPQSGQEEGD